MPFPSESNWIIYTENELPITAVPNNVNPCSTDIVGDLSNPAAYYYIDPETETNREVSFRMRLNQTPLKSQSGEFKEFAWGVFINFGVNLKYTFTIDVSGGSYRLIIKNPFGVIIYSVLVEDVFGTDIRVIKANTKFPCAKTPDDDYFLDFKAPISAFEGFNFDITLFSLCYFTSTQNQILIKDIICGDEINKSVEPEVMLTKEVTDGPLYPECIDPEQETTWTYTLTVTNNSESTAEGLVVKDVINAELGLEDTDVSLTPSGTTSAEFDEETSTVTWNIGDLDPGNFETLVVTITGSFKYSGFKIINFATLTGDNIKPVGPVSDKGVCVNEEQGEIEITKTLIYGPTEINVCKKDRWTVEIKVTNVSEVKVYGVKVVDVLNENFVFTGEVPIYTPSMGAVFYDSPTSTLVWQVGDLEPDQEETLTIQFDGYFIMTGLQYLNEARASAINADTTDIVRDEGVNVLASYENMIINISGKIIDCKTKELLEGVTVKVYKQCSLIKTEVFDEEYSLNLPVGVYTIIFEKDGYYKKFIAPIIYTDEYIKYDVKLLKRKSVTDTFEDNLDLYVDRIVERIDGNILLDQIVCLHEKYDLECGSDVIDSFEYKIYDNKIILKFIIEKNIIYKYEGKDLMINLLEHSICYPLEEDVCDKQFKYKYIVKGFKFCRDLSKLYNYCDIEFKGFFVEPMDILVKGETEKDC
ncbi:DUF11 domain-containing protein [Caloramator sp. ALD01]|uniref:DUF11 domain-containing protein n=1 Tax=Caloramator sp. ALD01 TaxID=1031288 RepID=UPI0003FFE5F9|nr:DUF11 domain-containing protein [Caloramator sp. ALD01]